MDDAPNNPKTSGRAWATREANRYILELSERLRDERPIGFFCECGCMGVVVETPARYEAQGGAWIEDNEPR